MKQPDGLGKLAGKQLVGPSSPQQTKVSNYSLEPATKVARVNIVNLTSCLLKALLYICDRAQTGKDFLIHV